MPKSARVSKMSSFLQGLPWRRKLSCETTMRAMDRPPGGHRAVQRDLQKQVTSRDPISVDRKYEHHRDEETRCCSDMLQVHAKMMGRWTWSYPIRKQVVHSQWSFWLGILSVQPQTYEDDVLNQDALSQLRLAIHTGAPLAEVFWAATHRCKSRENKWGWCTQVGRPAIID